jgi:hypothetical protein
LFQKEVGLEIFNFENRFRCVGHAQCILIIAGFSGSAVTASWRDGENGNAELILAGKYSICTPTVSPVQRRGLLTIAASAVRLYKAEKKNVHSYAQDWNFY